MLTRKQQLKEARAWARENGETLKESRLRINGQQVYHTVKRDTGRVALENLTLQIIMDKIYFDGF